MHDTKAPDAPPAAIPRLLTDRELAPLLGVSVGFLQQDRRGPKRIPYIRLGDRCLYDPEAVLAAVRGLTIGGGLGGRRRIGEPR